MEQWAEIPTSTNTGLIRGIPAGLRALHPEPGHEVAARDDYYGSGETA